MASKLRRKRQLASKIETTEGSSIALAAADAKALVYDLTWRPGVRMFKRNPHRASLAPLTQIPGMRPATITGRVELRGSGSVATVPTCFERMLMCGYQQKTLGKITIGAVTGGPFQAGETVTGGTSSATGIVVFKTADGTTTLYLYVVSGTFQNAEVLTGTDSTATATSGSTVTTSQGYVLVPTSDMTVAKSETTSIYADGRVYGIRGARGRCQVQAKVGEPAFISLELQGAITTPADAALLTGISYQTTVPAPFLGASPVIGAYTPVFSEFDFDMNQTLEFDEDAGSSEGILSTIVTDREPMLKLNPKAAALASYNAFADWLAATEKLVDVTFGSTAGNRFRFVAPKAQVIAVEDQERNSLDLDGLSMQTSESHFGSEDDHMWVFY